VAQGEKKYGYMIQYYNICGEDFNKEVAENLEKRGVEYNGKSL